VYVPVKPLVGGYVWVIIVGNDLGDIFHGSGFSGDHGLWIQENTNGHKHE
jgi:hypothetical protein